MKNAIEMTTGTERDSTHPTVFSAPDWALETDVLAWQQSE
jgi:hypothetical protein